MIKRRVFNLGRAKAAPLQALGELSPQSAIKQASNDHGKATCALPSRAFPGRLIVFTRIENFNDALLDGRIEIDLVEDQFPLRKRPR